MLTAALVCLSLCQAAESPLEAGLIELQAIRDERFRRLTARHQDDAAVEPALDLELRCQGVLRLASSIASGPARDGRNFETVNFRLA